MSHTARLFVLLVVLGLAALFLLGSAPLEPRGNLIDGAAGGTLRPAIPCDRPGSLSSTITDVPIGLYVATARLARRSGAVHTVLFSTRWPALPVDRRTELALQFDPAVVGVAPMKIWAHPSPPARQAAGMEDGLQ